MPASGLNKRLNGIVTQMHIPRTLISGSSASIVSTLVLGLCGAREEGAAAGPLNGPSQWLWGESEAYTQELTWRHTATGYAIHHAMSLLWASAYEQLQDQAAEQSGALRLLRTCGNAALIATLAYRTDYGIAPRRLRPGFKKHLGSRSILLVYAGFGFGLALASVLGAGDLSQRRRARKLSQQL